jgi:hypothetical protein
MFKGQRNTWHARFGLGCCLAAVLGLPGCGNKDKVKLLPVEGKVLLGDKVLATDAKTKGTVVLHPDKSRGNDSLEIPRGSIDSEGKFKILTRLQPGVTPGWYKVTVDAATVIDPKNPYHSASGFLIPEYYIHEDESNLAFEVVDNAPAGTYDLKLNSK